MTADELLLEDYLTSHSDAEPAYLAEIRRHSYQYLVNPRMISDVLQGRWLAMLTRMIMPRSVLEIGTLSGYSALCIAEGLADGGIVHTIEIDDELEDFIRQNLAKSESDNRVKLHIGDALEVIDNLNCAFDMVFIDADKRQYRDYYEKILPKLPSGAFIIADNTLWGGKIFDRIKSGDHQTRAIAEFNDFLAKDERVEKIILPVRDGLTIIRKV